MLGKDITLFTIFQLADWGRVCTPTFLFQISPQLPEQSISMICFLLFLAVAVYIAWNRPFTKQTVLNCFLVLACTSLMLGSSFTAMLQRRGFAVVRDSTIPVEMKLISEVSTFQVVPFVHCLLAFVVILGIAVGVQVFESKSARQIESTD
jgi:hypothetical protein